MSIAKQPCVPLKKAFYGRPESGYHWDARLKESWPPWAEKLDNDHRSNYTFETGLLWTLGVDDALLPGPESLRAPFWAALQKHVALEELHRCFGGNHYCIRHFIMQSCEAYISLTGQNVKEAVSPYVADGKVCETDCTAEVN